jgi:hypothetical protein
MDKSAFEKFKRDYGLKILVQESQFEQWLMFFFYLNEELHKGYDTIYQSSFYIKLYELLNEGSAYAKEVLDSLSSRVNVEKIKWYNKLDKGLSEIRSTFSDDEFEFIEYKRHSASHIFQNKYEVEIKKNGSLKTKYKNSESLDEINSRFQKIILKHGSDKNFDIYVTTKLYPLISQLYYDLTQKT